MRGRQKKDRSEGRINRNDDGKGERKRLKLDVFNITTKPLIH
jgi:hypothetical protein